MMQNSVQVRVISRLGVVAAALALVVGCAQQPKPVTVSDSVEATATVEAIDQATRMVRLRGADGRLWVVQAGPSVRNIGQVKPGDLVKVRYTEAIAAEVVKPGTGVTSGGATAALQRADAGKLPGATETVSMKGVVKVAAVDTANNTVDIISVRWHHPSHQGCRPEGEGVHPRPAHWRRGSAYFQRSTRHLGRTGTLSRHRCVTDLPFAPRGAGRGR